MPKQQYFRRSHLIAFATTCCLSVVASLQLLTAVPVMAMSTSSSGTVDITATVVPTAPTVPAIINDPVNASHVDTTPLVVSGTCGPNLTVRIFDNGVLGGTGTCDAGGAFSLNITLDFGSNVLTVLNYDGYGQVGPASTPVTIYVDQATPSSLANEAAIDSQQTIAGAIGSSADTSTSPDGTTLGDNDSQRLFEGTFIEPVAKLLNVGTTVSPQLNSVATVATNVVFAFMVLGLLVILLL